MSFQVQPARVAFLDIIRGFALAGILVINAMSILAVKGSTPAFTVPLPIAHRALQDMILFFIESKFFTLFSLLFGIGFAIQIKSAARQGQAFVPRILRRMGALVLFGLAHIALLWDGDILLVYGVTGLLLVAFRTATLKTLRRWIVSLLLIPGALVLLIFTATVVLRSVPDFAHALAASDSQISLQFADIGNNGLAKAGFLQGIPLRLASYSDTAGLLASRIPTVLAMFLLGLYIGRSNFIRQLDVNINNLRRIRFWGLTVGFALMALILTATKLLPATSALVAIFEDQYLAGPILCLGYASAMALAYLKRPNLRMFQAFASVGQMALTNYLTQSLVLTYLANGWGLGIAGKLDGFGVLAISAALYFAQVLFSSVWLSRFNFGPLEWLWRAVTYWKAPTLRRVRIETP